MPLKQIEEVGKLGIEGTVILIVNSGGPIKRILPEKIDSTVCSFCGRRIHYARGLEAEEALKFHYGVCDRYQTSVSRQKKDQYYLR